MPKPPKDKYKNKNKGKKDESSDEEDEKKKNKPYKKKDGRRKNITKIRREAKLTLLVIGSPTLSHHVSPSTMRATTRKRRSPHF
jgi:hypothetical protein